ncbi:hypothetical protein GCM10009087_01840 [Sphingomonas oligophenolica]|uniref:Uncharacterized protein n=1 Tax=Sphingomonas oligophenolica TaxID=301154 RepID=A0ABU9Y0X6_9SPHN
MMAFGTSEFDRAGHQQRVDEIQAEVRRQAASNSLPKPVPVRVPPLTKSPTLLNTRLAEELDYINRLLESVGDQLVADPVMLQRHAVALQSFDLIGQMIGHISNIISAANPNDAVARVGIEDMRNRLHRAG